jgi:hypothetical protein
MMGRPWLVQVGCIGLRFLRFKLNPWIVLVIAPATLFSASEYHRNYTKIRCMKAMTQIDFVRVYEFLNDLIW